MTSPAPPRPDQYEPVAEWFEGHAEAPRSRFVVEFAGAGFVVERLVEPQPDPSLATSHPDVHERLSTRPGFVFFRLLKHPRAGCGIRSDTAFPAMTFPEESPSRLSKRAGQHDVITYGDTESCTNRPRRHPR